MTDLTKQRCFNHANREAVAVCPECHRFFCRECVTEHEDRVLCANCISNVKIPTFKKKKFSAIFRFIFFLGSLFFLWFFFYYMGQLLLKLPASFHEGTLWKNLWDVI